ncbi:hypothetical protein QNI19_06775 [Cytophagaceae bacterium DM2B3-1]|uniref:Uncharacterized protein n=1 Tax=Xanthocytophaga flava TaxID=3048013 RepID=A0ABT7CFW2_9BACT|nr:hypothetical protein [Xanthocytophaga flavus]MDJ1466633.1 hypothetical protein [Xanthocytophaga flavus]MDJ1492629.1 hypothetical protein [Xanthocytophaga flavus]
MKGHLLFGLGIIPLIISMFIPNFSWLISIGWRTMIVPAFSTFPLNIVGILVLIALIYWLFYRAKRKVNRALTICHAIFTFIPIYLLLVVGPLASIQSNAFVNFIFLVNKESYLLFFVGQALFLGNIIWSMIQKPQR